MQKPENLRVWHRATDFAIQVIQAFPVTTGRIVPGLRSQAIRAATSVPANIAEGCGLTGPGGLARHLEIAVGSLNELDVHISIGAKMNVIDAETAERLHADCAVVRKMCIGLLRAIKTKNG